MTTHHDAAAAVVLCDGSVLVTGGYDASSSLSASAERYDWTTGTWSPAPSMGVARAYHGAVRLNDCRVLVAGGRTPSGPSASAEIYDPTTDAWSAAASLAFARGELGRDSSVLLDDGQVLFVGGYDGVNWLTSAERYDPALDQWQAAGDTCAAGGTNCAPKFLAVKLLDGRVLAAGGGSTEGRLSYLYDPPSNSWCQTGSLPEAGFSAMGLVPGTGQVVGDIGCNEAGWCEDPDTYIYTPAAAPSCAGTWSYAGSLSPEHKNGRYLGLPDGGVAYIAGDLWPGGYVNTVHVYKGGWTQGPSLNSGRGQPAAAVVGGRLLVAGGLSGGYSSPTYLTSAELIALLPDLAIQDVAVTEGDSGTTSAVFTVSLSSASGQTVTVDYATANGTAAAGSDYTAASGTLTFPPGTTTQQVVVTVQGDTLYETDENLVVNLLNAANAGIADAQAQGTILNDDLEPTLSVSDAAITEGDSATANVIFAISLSAVSGLTSTVNYFTADGTATSGSDYISTSGTLTFSPGTTTKAVSVAVVGDILDEPDETFTLNLGSPGNATIASGQGVGTIADDDPEPALSIGDVTVAEGNSGTVDAVFTVSLSASSGQTVTVVYATANGTAVAGSDYTGTSGTLTLPPGTTTRTVTVLVSGDALSEPDETFFVNLSGAVKATIADGQGLGTITNDDAVTTAGLSVDDVTVAEGNSGTATASFTVSLSAAVGQTVTVAYATADGTASAGEDYLRTSGTLTFSPGTTTLTVPVTVEGDTLDEADETFLFSLSNPGNATIARSQGVATILDDDPAPALFVDAATITEGNSGTALLGLGVSLSASSGQTVSVAYATADGSATAGYDYLPVSGRLTFDPGTTQGTVTVPVVGDTFDEANETFSLNLAGPTNATIGGGRGLATILDDDPPPALSVGDVSVGESEGTAVLPVSLSAASGRAVSVSYATADGTASVDASDYTFAAGTLTFEPGEIAKAVTAFVVPDTTVEEDETFTVNLSSPLNATIAAPRGTATIKDDDLAVTSFTVSPATATGPGTATLTWVTKGATAVTVSGVSGPLPTSGNTEVGFTGTTDFTLTATGAGGRTATAEATVAVLPPAGVAVGIPQVTNLSPGDVVRVAGVTFKWSEVSTTLGPATGVAVTGYGLNIFDALNGKTLFDGSLTGSTATETLIDLHEGDYVFTVRACTEGTVSDAKCGSFGSVPLIVDLVEPSSAPAVIFPAPGATLVTSTQELRWMPVAKAEASQLLFYEVLLEDQVTGLPVLQIRLPETDTSTIASLRSSDLYRLTVRACQSGCGPYSDPVLFSLHLPPIPTVAPTLATPTLNGELLTVSWSAVAGADLYRIQVVQPTGGAGGGALTVAARETAATSVTLPVPKGQANIVVWACNGDGCGPVSDAVPIAPAVADPSQPNLGTPLAGSVVDGPVVKFSWSRVPGDDGTNTVYRLFVQDLSRQATALDVRTRDNFYAAYLKAEGARYDVLVIANPGCTGASATCSGAEIQGPAAGFNVRGASSTAPTMVSPAHNSTVAQGNIELGWSPVPGATVYEYFVAVQGVSAATVRGVTPGLFVQVPLSAAGGADTVYSGIVRACPSGATCAAGSDAGWGPWSNQAGPGVTNFTVTP